MQFILKRWNQNTSSLLLCIYSTWTLIESSMKHLNYGAINACYGFPGHTMAQMIMFFNVCTRKKRSLLLSKEERSGTLNMWGERSINDFAKKSRRKTEPPSKAHILDEECAAMDRTDISYFISICSKSDYHQRPLSITQWRSLEVMASM